MATTYRSDSQIPPHPEVPDETRHRLIEQMAVRELATLRKLHRAAATNQKLQDQYRSQVEKLFGRAKYRRFRDYVQKAREEEVAKLRSPKGRELPLEQKERLVKKRADAADAYLEKLGVSADALRGLNKSWAKRIVPESKPAEDARARLVPLRQVPKGILKRKTNPWTIKEPPYDGWLWWLWIDLSGNMWWNDQEDALWVEPDTGTVGDSVGLANYGDATDWDSGHTQRKEVVGFWYQMPAAGLVEMWVEAQMVFNEHRYDSYVEWGWADWSFRQENAITMTAEGSSEGSAVWSVMSGASIFERHWDEHWWTSGDTGWFHYVSDNTYARNEWVWVHAGNQNTVDSFANDFKNDCWMSFRWFIKSIHVHSTGGD